MSDAIRGTLHVLSTLVVVPYALLAVAFLLLGKAIARGSLAGLLSSLFWDALWIIPWGVISAVGVVAIVAVLGAFPGSRWLGALSLCALSLGSLIVLVTVPSGPIGSGELTFLAPCIAVAGFAAWLAYAELARRGVS